MMPSIMAGASPDWLLPPSLARWRRWLVQNGHMYGGAGAVALVGLTTGLEPRSDVLVEADVHVVGRSEGRDEAADDCVCEARPGRACAAAAD